MESKAVSGGQISKKFELKNACRQRWRVGDHKITYIVLLAWSLQLTDAEKF